VTYKIPNYRFDGVRSFTNKPPGGPKRGHGTPQPRFAVEVQLDKAAEHFGLDPAELRLKTMQPANSNTANWLRIGSMGLGECIEKVVEASGWKERHGKLPRGHGLGLACSSYITGAGLPIYWNSMPHSGVQLKLDRGGGVTAFCGATDIGQGSDTVLAACTAEILGVDIMDVRVCVSDTDLTPVDLGSYSSRVTLMMGNAAIQAILSFESADVLADRLGELHFVLAGFDVFTAKALDELREEHRLHRLDRRELILCGIPVLFGKNVSVDRRLVRVVSEEIPSSEDQVVHVGERHEVTNQRRPRLGPLAEPDRPHLRQRADRLGQAPACQKGPRNERRTHRTHPRQKHTEFTCSGLDLGLCHFCLLLVGARCAQEEVYHADSTRRSPRMHAGLHIFTAIIGKSTFRSRFR